MPLLLMTCVICLFFAGCQKNKDIRDGIISMQSSKVTIDEDSILCVNGESIFIEHTPQFRLVVYVDSSECSSCSINQLKYWQSFMSKYNSQSNIQLLILLEAKKGEIPSIEGDIASAELNNIIFIDSNFVFRRQNPQIPPNSMYHTFLLNEMDSVVLVGNPLRNGRVEKMFEKIIEWQSGSTIVR